MLSEVPEVHRVTFRNGGGRASRQQVATEDICSRMVCRSDAEFVVVCRTAGRSKCFLIGK